MPLKDRKAHFEYNKEWNREHYQGSKMKHLEVRICPKCKEKGYLNALFIKRNDRWFFMGFRMQHKKPKARTCYLGKTCPN